MHLKKILSVLCIAAILLGTARFCHHQTRGFRLSKITNNTCELLADTLPGDSPPHIHSLLSQKFCYFARGKQSFAFLSEDGEYILKIFNNTYQRKIQFFHILAYLPFLHTWAKTKEDYFRYKLNKTFQSYQIAMQEMQEMSGLHYVHPSLSQSLPDQLILVDALNIEHILDPNQLGFLIQKKMTLAYPALKQMVEEQHWEQAQEAIHSLLNLFFWKFRNGIADNDPLIRTNYGFIGTQAYQIDVGPLSKDASIKKIEHQRPEIARISANLKNWLNQNAPQLIPFLDRELEDHLTYGDETPP